MIKITAKKPDFVDATTLESDSFFNPILTDEPRIDFRETLYFFSNKLGTFLFHSDESYSFSIIKIDVCQKKLLQGLHFFKINKFYWVNFEYVARVIQFGTENYCELTNGELLLISKSNLVAFQKVLLVRHISKCN